VQNVRVVRCCSSETCDNKHRCTVRVWAATLCVLRCKCRSWCSSQLRTVTLHYVNKTAVHCVQNVPIFCQQELHHYACSNTSGCKKITNWRSRFFTCSRDVIAVIWRRVYVEVLRSRSCSDCPDKRKPKTLRQMLINFSWICSSPRNRFLSTTSNTGEETISWTWTTCLLFCLVKAIRLTDDAGCKKAT